MDQQSAVVDALPYFDKGYGESGMQEANALLTEEMRRYRPTKNYLENFPTLAGPISTKFETEIMRTEFNRLANRLPMELLSMKRYELPPPPSGKMGDLRAWQEAIENAHVRSCVCLFQILLMKIFLKLAKRTIFFWLHIPLIHLIFPFRKVYFYQVTCT